MGTRTYALIGRHGDDGGRYLSSQLAQLKTRAWEMHRAGNMVQVWRCDMHGELARYDGETTQRVTDYIVKASAAIAQAEGK